MRTSSVHEKSAGVAVHNCADWPESWVTISAARNSHVGLLCKGYKGTWVKWPSSPQISISGIPQWMEGSCAEFESSLHL